MPKRVSLDQVQTLRARVFLVLCVPTLPDDSLSRAIALIIR